MMRYRHPRVDLLRERGRAKRTAAPRAASPTERLLDAFGAHPSFTDALLGDLAEEHARRAEAEGTVAARWWYLREAFRSAPHLLWNALRHGGARGRARAIAMLAGVTIVPSIVMIAVTFRPAPAARLVVDGEGTNGGVNGIVLNSRRPVRLGIRALDAEGHTLHSATVQFRRMTGTSLQVTPDGVVTCTRSGDGTVRASAGAVATTVLLRCRPVVQVNVENQINLLAGGTGHDLALEAVGPDGRLVDLLAGEVRMEDSTIAALTGTHIRPLRTGRTWMTVQIGDEELVRRINVYEVVRTFDGLRPDQQLVVAPVRLTRGETLHWSLPTGLYYLRFDAAPGAQTPPNLTVDGPVMCMPEFGPTVHDSFCLARANGASVRIANPSTSTDDVVGSLSLEGHDEMLGSPPAPRIRRTP